MKISFIVHVRIDNHLREKNLRAVIPFYIKHHPDAEFIFAIDDYNSTNVNKLITEIVQGHKNIQTIVDGSVSEGDPVRKCKGYNSGGRQATGDVLIFLDADVIVDPEISIPEIENIYNANELDVHIGYNGTALYMTDLGEEKFLKTGCINALTSSWMIDSKDCIFKTGQRTAKYLCGNTQAVGGFLAMTKQAFKRINGFNPNFIGWGYEDNEVVMRAHKLGQNVTKSSNPYNILYHLPHEIVEKDKSRHQYYESNHKEMFKIESILTREQLEEHIKTW